jgi:hypothetical protein
MDCHSGLGLAPARLGCCGGAADAIFEMLRAGPEMHLGSLLLAAVNFRTRLEHFNPYLNILCHPSIVFFIKVKFSHIKVKCSL